MSIEFEWDPAKARENLRKHGIRFADAQQAFADEQAVLIEDQFPFEPRFILIGRDAIDQILVVIFTWRNDIIRIISVRKATPRERQQYEGDV
jgi:uncharacterized protein